MNACWFYFLFPFFFWCYYYVNKTILGQRIPDNYKSFLKRRQEKLNEARFQLKYQNNKNVVRILDVCEDFGRTIKNQHYIIFIQEYCQGGDLIQHIENYHYLTQGPGLHLEDIRIIAKQLVNVIKILHSDNIAHCDIKLDNILCANFSSQPVVKRKFFFLSYFLLYFY